MSFWKAEQLLALATLAAARHAGVTIDDVIERFSVSKRTAQRMLRTLEAHSPIPASPSTAKAASAGTCHRARSGI